MMYSLCLFITTTRSRSREERKSKQQTIQEKHHEYPCNTNELMNVPPPALIIVSSISITTSYLAVLMAPTLSNNSTRPKNDNDEKQSTSKNRKQPSASSVDTMSTLIQNIPSHYIHPILQQGDDPQIILTQLTAKAREYLRLFNSKTTRGQLLCNGDSIEARSAVVLEFILRNGFMISNNNGSVQVISPSVRVPLSVLGKIVGIGKKDIEKVGLVCGLTLNRMGVHNNNVRGNTDNANERRANTGNHNHPLRTQSARGSTKNVLNSSLSNRTRSLGKYRTVHERNAARFLSLGAKNNRNARPTMNKSNVNNSSTSIPASISTTNQIKELTQSSSSSHIQNLCIKLQSYLHDPNNIEIKSKLLWYNLIQYKIQTERENNRHEHAVLYDLKTHQIYYEGACFYVTVQDLEHGSFMNRGSDGAGGLNGVLSESSSKNKAYFTKGRKKSQSNQHSSHATTGHHQHQKQMDGKSKDDKSQTKSNAKDDDEDDDENMLTIEHIIHELRIDYAFFSDILDEVTSSVRSMGYKKRYHDVNDEREKQDRRRKAIPLENDGSSSIVEDGHSSKRSRKETTTIDNEMKDDLSYGQTQSKTYSIDHDMPSNSKAKYIDVNKFFEWKQSILSDILSSCSSKPEIEPKIRQPLDSSSMCCNDETLIKNHAKDILKQL